MKSPKTKWTRHTAKWTVSYKSDCGRGEIRKLPWHYTLLVDGKRLADDRLQGCKEMFTDFLNDTP
jgi:hypothetical protein